MLKFVAGVILGIYLEQTYHFPNVYEKLLEFDRYLKEHNRKNGGGQDRGKTNS